MFGETISKLKHHNPFAMPDTPDFEESGFKWWGIGSDAPDGIAAAYVELPDGDRNYVLIDARGVISDTEMRVWRVK